MNSTAHEFFAGVLDAHPDARACVSSVYFALPIGALLLASEALGLSRCRFNGLVHMVMTLVRERAGVVSTVAAGTT